MQKPRLQQISKRLEIVKKEGTKESVALSLVETGSNCSHRSFGPLQPAVVYTHNSRYRVWEENVVYMAEEEDFLFHDRLGLQRMQSFMKI